MVEVVKLEDTPDCGSGIHNGCAGSTPVLHPKENLCIG